MYSYICSLTQIAAVSGDARRALNVCRRAAEIAELANQSSDATQVTIFHVSKALEEMSSSPLLRAIQTASAYEKQFLIALLTCFRRTS
eukprot:m.81708 g.81708  ORF g.81708 m.81708 type:complete len:88 (+) comp12651_c0_seq3:1876-2139(+)